MKVMLISFSSRTGGNCDQICDYVASYYQNSAVFRFSQHRIQPCGGCRYECFQSNEACPHIQDPEYGLLDDICGSDLVYFVIPNYCDYPCANYFIFNERSQCYFQGKYERLNKYLNIRKKFIVISNTNQENFRQILAQQSNDEPNILFLSAKKFGKSSVTGDITESESALREIRTFIQDDEANSD